MFTHYYHKAIRHHYHNPSGLTEPGMENTFCHHDNKMRSITSFLTIRREFKPKSTETISFHFNIYYYGKMLAHPSRSRCKRRTNLIGQNNILNIFNFTDLDFISI